LLSNYNIKYICTIYTRLYTCLTPIPRFALREKVTLRLLMILFQGVGVVEWSRTLDVRLSEWCCSVSMVWVQIPSTALKSNSNTVWFNFQTYIYKHVSPEALITGRMIPSRTPQAEVSSNKLAQYLKTRYFGCWKCKYIYI
jgi:hypothetical protein